MSSAPSIDQALRIMKAPSPENFYILDIDSTLVSTHQRNQKIVEDWIALHGKLYPEDCEALSQGRCALNDYGLKGLMDRIQFKEKNLGSQASLHQFWRQNFFSNQYLPSDVAMPGAVEWVQNLRSRSVAFVYLTARHKATMWEGTLSSMGALGFPISPEKLFLKENLEEPDALYKSQLMTKLIQDWGHKKIWLIDNEPVVLHQIREDHPGVNLIYFESTHSGKKAPPEQIPWIRDFHLKL